jgi:hypothetical protein
MAKSNSTRAPKLRCEKVTYVDDARDYRDGVVLDAIKAAIDLIEDNEAPALACSVLRLVRDRLEARWPNNDVKFIGELAPHG